MNNFMGTACYEGSMSDNSAPTKTISDFEAKLSEADKTVAAFDSSREGMLFRFRSLLREYPTSIPAMVLLLSVFCFGFNALFINPNNFLTATAFSTYHSATGDSDRHCRRGPDHHYSHSGH